MPKVTKCPKYRDDREFVRFMARVRRRLILLCFAFYFLPGAVLGTLLALICVRYFPVDVPAGTSGLTAGILGAATVCGALGLMLPLRKRHVLLRDYIAGVDRAYDAAGRIQATVDFIQHARTLDAFQRLALADAASWIAEHPRTGLPWSWRHGRKSIKTALAAVVCVLFIVGCEAPQPVKPHPKPTKPEKPVVMPIEGTANSQPTKEEPAIVQTETQPAPAGESPGDTYAGGSEDKRAGAGGRCEEGGPGPGEKPGPEQDGGSTSSPTSQPEPMTPREPQNNSAEPPKPDSRPTAPPNSQPSVGGGAGTETAPKQEEQRRVEAPEEQIAAKHTNDESGQATGKEEEGEGEDLVPGSQPAPVSQPADTIDFRQARRQDLTRERVSPERRALIERYFQRLNEKQEHSASQPTSRPASRPTSRPSTTAASRPAEKERSP